MADVRHCADSEVMILPVSLKELGTMYFTYFRHLRAQKDIVLPDGIQILGEQWFKNSEIQSVTIPASMREIA